VLHAFVLFAGEFAIQGVLLDLQDLTQPANMTFFLCKLGGNKRMDQFHGHFVTYDARTQAQHIHVIVFDALMSGIGVMADPRTDAGNLVGCHADADSTAAQQDSAIRAAVKNRLSDLPGKIWIVDGAIGIRPAIDDVVSRRLNDGADPLLQRKTTMITSQRNSHDFQIPVCLRFSELT
jgi:hypothetical protein